MTNVGEKIKVMATFLLVLGLSIGLIWFVIVLLQFFSNPIVQRNEAVSILATILYPACLILSSLVSFLLMYGFGQLVENSDIMAKYQTREFIDNEFKDFKDSYNNMQNEK